VTGISADQLKIILFDVPASWIMQGGQMMPHPGHDQEWLDRLRVVEK
jgi:hypothetical protein